MGLFAAIAWASFRTAFAESDRDGARIAAIGREHAAKVLDSDRLVADRVNQLLQGLSDQLIRLSEGDLRRDIQNIITGLPQVQSLVVVGRDGHGLLATGAWPMLPIDFSDRDWFTALRTNATPTYISRLEVSRVTGRPFFGLGRRRETATGAFDGATDVALSPGFFAQFYQTLLGDAAPDGDGWVIKLVRDDGQILVRFPTESQRPQSATASTAFLEAITRHPTGGRYVVPAIAAQDQPEQRCVYERVPGYPTFVVIGRSTDAIVAGWRRTMARYLIVGGSATAALFFVSWTALRRTLREQAALTRVREEAARREAAEAELRQSQRLEAVGQLTAGIAHDFNNLLTVISGNLELMADAASLDRRSQRRVEHMRAAADRGSRLTGQLLAFARKQRLDPRPIDLNEVVTGMQPLLHSAIGGTVGIKVALEPALWPALADRGQLELAILNLAINARDAVPVGGSLAIETANAVLGPPVRPEDPPAGEYVMVVVRDRGAGMAPEVLARAIEPFFTTKEPGRGSGLGLSQVHGFAHQSGGSVKIDSTVGVGTTVRIYLPRAGAMPAAADAPRQQAPAPGGQGVILVVDDDHDVRAVTAHMLTNLGYTTVEAGNGPAALEELDREAGVTLAVLDYAMPGMNGVELARAVRARRPGLPFLFVTGYANTEALAREVPLDRILPKPFTAADLGAKVRGALAAGG